MGRAPTLRTFSDFLAIERYATILEDEGVNYLYMKTAVDRGSGSEVVVGGHLLLTELLVP